MRDFRKPNFNSQIGEEIKQVFRSAVLEDEVFDEDGINVELAAPWRRIAAAASGDRGRRACAPCGGP